MASQQILETTIDLDVPRDAVFDFFADAGNLQRITPPELGFQIETPLPIAMAPGAIIEYRLRLYGIRFRWRTEITTWDPPARFVDEQRSGPYAEWIHLHEFSILPTGGTRITDRVRYRLPLGYAGQLALPIVRGQVKRIFGYRERKVREIFQGENKTR